MSIAIGRKSAKLYGLGTGFYKNRLHTETCPGVVPPQGATAEIELALRRGIRTFRELRLRAE
jgi:hypothetical protein